MNVSPSNHRQKQQCPSFRVSYSGAVEAVSSTPGSQTIEVDLKSVNTLLPDTLLAATHPAVALPSGVWPGVLLPYSGIYTFAIDSAGDVYGSDGNSGQAHPQVYQRLIERRWVPNASSPPIGL